ncbi:MAG: hypothetical protein JXR95_11010 [Deltaproteobacteria bacterium]|nr:hypothetical protein [Deltaproteobacteria bacterium]
MAKSKIQVCIVSGCESSLVRNVEEIIASVNSSVNVQTVSWDGLDKLDKYQLGVLIIGSGEENMALEFSRDVSPFHRKLIPVLPSETTLETVVEFLQLDDVDQILRREFTWESNLRALMLVLFTGAIFGMEKYLSEKDEVSYLRFKDYQGRQLVLDKVRDVARDMGLRRIRREHAVQAAEELVMNALYNAPREEDGNMMFGNIDPHKRVNMDSPKPVSLRYSETQEGLYMAVRDRFGALDKKTVLAYISKCLYSKEQIDRKTIGAGLGIYLTIRRVQSYIVNVAPNIATEVIISLKQTKEIGVPAVIAFFEYSSGSEQ